MHANNEAERQEGREKDNEKGLGSPGASLVSPIVPLERTPLFFKIGGRWSGRGEEIEKKVRMEAEVKGMQEEPV